MKRYRYMALAFLTVVLAIGLFFSLLPKEPVYEGRPISAWIGQLTGGVGSSAGAVSSHTLPKLLEQKPGKEIVPYLRQTLHRGTSLKDQAYAKIYFKLPAFLQRKLPMPNPARDAELRYRAGLIFYYMGPEAKEALRDLVESLKDPDAEVRRISATVLGSLGADAKSAAPGLTTASRDPSPDVRRAALKALAGAESDPVATVPVLAQLLKDPEEGVRTDAAQILRDLGPKARTAEYTRPGPGLFFIVSGQGTFKHQNAQWVTTNGSGGYFFEDGSDPIVLENKPITPNRILAVEFLPASLAKQPSTIPTGQ